MPNLTKVSYQIHPNSWKASMKDLILPLYVIQHTEQLHANVLTPLNMVLLAHHHAQHLKPKSMPPYLDVNAQDKERPLGSQTTIALPVQLIITLQIHVTKNV